ncbi:MAG: calycin-like domain-containing protein [Alloprevotella sp.]
MKQLLTLVWLGAAALSASAQHLPNGDFAKWKDACGNSYQSSTSKFIGGNSPDGERQRPGSEPEDWNGSSVNQKVMGTEKQETLVTQGSQDGNSWTVLTNKWVGALGIGSNAPAFINFGTPWVYAVTSIDNCDGGVYGGMAFSSRPDAIKGRYKRTTGTEGSEDAHIIAYLWKGTFTSNITATGTVSKDDVDRVVMGKETGTASGTLIASCDYSFSSTANNDWEEIIVPLDYVQGQEQTVPEKVNVIISSADYWTRTNIKAGNVLEVDDVDFVYYHALSDLQVDGVTLEGFDESRTDYTLDVPYEAGKVTYTVKGRSAQAQETYDEESGLLTIVVTNEGEATTYTVQFDNRTATVTPYSNDLSVTINGECTLPQPTEIQLIDEKDGSTSLALNNFMLGTGADAIPVGNIYLTNVQRSGENPMKLTTSQSIVITPGDLPGIDAMQWIGQFLGEVPVELDAEVADGQMTATINIDMQASLGQTIRVVFAPTLNVNAETDLNAEAGLYNLVVSRNFSEGWNTLCLPFGFTPEQIGAEEAQTFVGTQNNIAQFIKVSEVDANQPCMVKFANDTPVQLCLATYIHTTQPGSVFFDGFYFNGNYAAGMPMSGYYGFEPVEGLRRVGEDDIDQSLPATHAYFAHTEPNDLYYQIQFEGEQPTRISEAGLMPSANAPVYNLQGVRMTNSPDRLPAGIYVSQGKKVLVK